MDRTHIQTLILTSLVSFLINHVAIVAAGQDLRKFKTEVCLFVEKDTVFTRQPVWATLRIMNGDRPGPKIDVHGLTKQFIIREKSGLVLAFLPDEPALHTARLNPGCILEERLNIITPYYRLGKRDPYLVPGEYTAVFVWEEPGYEILLSDSVHITVCDPSGKENRALKLLNEGDRHYRLGDIQKSDLFYERLVQRYPNSMYAAGALDLKFRNHDRRMGQDHERIRMKVAVKLIDEYGEGMFNITRMFYELEMVIDAGSIPDMLREYLGRWALHPSERIRTPAARLLRKWDAKLR